MLRPDYEGGSLVNLMASIISARGGTTGDYPTLRDIDSHVWKNSRHLLLLVIDGLGYAYLTQQGQDSTLHHFLQGRLTSVFPTTTASAITTFLTGDAPQQHGLTGWHVYLKEIGAVTAVLPFRARYGDFPLSESGIDAGRFFDHIPVFDRIRSGSLIIAPAWIVDSAFNRAHAGRAERQGFESLGECFSLMQEACSDASTSRYIYAYWPEFDRLAHQYGVNSPQVRQHFAELDQRFACFIDDIAGTETTVIVTADHGFIDTTPAQTIELDTHPSLAETLTLPLCGESRAAYCYVHPGRVTQFEDYIDKHLSHAVNLRRSTELIEAGYFGLGAAHPGLQSRSGDYCLLMKENYVIKDWLFSEQAYQHIGVHGGLSAEEIYVPLIVISA